MIKFVLDLLHREQRELWFGHPGHDAVAPATRRTRVWDVDSRVESSSLIAFYKRNAAMRLRKTP